jgi:uncharacterized membrane protein
LAAKQIKPVSITRQDLKTPSEFETFIGLKLIHFVGIVVLITGLTIGVKYAIDVNLVSALIRIILAYAAGVLMFLISRILLKKYEVFSMVLFSGAMADIYLTTYAAFAYYGILSRWIAFAMMLIMTLFTILKSLRFNRQEIAVLALVGAYGIPFFVRGESENISGLFAYVFIINSGILFLSFKRYWLLLSYWSFFITWIMLFSGIFTYSGITYTITETIFCLLFFVLFTVNSLGFKLFRKQVIASSDTLVIICNTVFLYSALFILFGINSPDYSSGITMLFSIFYLIAGLITKMFLRRQRFLSDAFFAISIIALDSFFAMRYSGFSITVIWVILAISSFLIGTWFKMKIFRVSAIILFGATLVKLLFLDSGNFGAIEKVIAYLFTGTILLVVSFLYQKFKKRIFDDSGSSINVSG